MFEHKVYEGEVTFLPSTDKDNNPRDGTRCRAGYVHCTCNTFGATLSFHFPNSEYHFNNDCKACQQS